MTKLEYIWIDGYGTLRSKTKIIKLQPWQSLSLDDLKEWNYDGSSTNQAQGSDSEIVLKPVQVFPDPFRKKKNTQSNNDLIDPRTAVRHNNALVLCETYHVDGRPTNSNTRYNANKIFEKYKHLEPMYGIEQEFFISKNGIPIAFLESEPKEQKNYYCGVGGDNIYERDLIEEVLDNCLYSGLNITGLNAEVAPSQWELQVCSTGIKAADQLIILRYICNKTLEKHSYNMDIHPKPITEGDWNGSGCHVNFSTKIMREKDGMKNIIKSIENLGKHHSKSILLYGEDNDKRLTGKHETSSIEEFTYGVANRMSSVRIPRECEKNNCGYFEDRRPSSNMDPYLVTSSILEFIQ